MSERVRARRHHRTAQSSGWAIPPETCALFIPVVLAVVLMPLGMGGRHPVGQLLLSCAAIAAAGAWLFRSYHANDAGWQFSILDVLFAAGIAVAVIQVIPISSSHQKYFPTSFNTSTMLDRRAVDPWAMEHPFIDSR